MSRLEGRSYEIGKSSPSMSYLEELCAKVDPASDAGEDIHNWMLERACAEVDSLRARLAVAYAALAAARLPDNNDKNITNIAAIIADYVTPEGHDPEEWGQLCELAEKVLRKLNLCKAALHPATKEGNK